MANSIMTWRIGRAAECEIRLDHGSVSRRHAELTRGSDNSYYLIDCGSSHGSHMWDGGGWKDANHCFIGPGDRLRFGDFEISLDSLVAMATRRGSASVSYQSNGHAADDSRPAGPVVRNPETGEVESR